MVKINIYKFLCFLSVFVNFLAIEAIADTNRCEVFLKILHEKSELMAILKAQGESADPVIEKRVGRLERLETRIRARPERQFWSGFQLFETDEDVRRAVEGGELVPLDERPPLATGKIKYKYTLPEARLLARQITFDFVQRLKEKNLYSEKIKILITSAIRPVSFQRKLIEDGARQRLEAVIAMALLLTSPKNGLKKTIPKLQKFYIKR